MRRLAPQFLAALALTVAAMVAHGSEPSQSELAPTAKLRAFAVAAGW